MDTNKIDLWVEVVRDALIHGPEPRFPAEPPVGSVLRYQRTYENRSGPKTYDYLAFRAENGWHVTGRENRVLDWDELQERIGNNDCCMVVEYADIPKSKPNPLDEIEDPRDWIRAVFKSDDKQ